VEFFGGPPERTPTPAELYNAVVAFDALSPNEKLGLLASAVKAEGPALQAAEKAFSDFVETDFYCLTVSRNSVVYLTRAEIDMWRAIWTSDMNRSHGMDWAHREPISRMSSPHPLGRWTEDLLREALHQLPGRELLATLDAARKCKRPLPDDVPPRAAMPRDDQYFFWRVWGGRWVASSRDEIAAFRDEAIQRILMEREKEDRTLREKAADLVGGAREKAGDFADHAKDKAEGLVERAKDKARAVASNMKDKASRVGSDLKEKAEEEVKEVVRESTRGAFWKALGW
jgi:uncharacterized protein YjbJ (UPF0337 family)